MVGTRITRGRNLTVFLLLLGLVGAPFVANAQSPAAPPASPSSTSEATLAVLAFALAAVPAQGQLPIGAPAPGTDGAPAIELSLEVAARDIVFDVLPRVRTPASGPRRATWRVERVNLPAHIEPGLTYHDVAIRVFLVATPTAFQALLADARRAAPYLRITPAAASTQVGATSGLAGRP